MIMAAAQWRPISLFTDTNWSLSRTNQWEAAASEYLH